MTSQTVTFYPFAYGLPWCVSDYVVTPLLSDSLWENFIIARANNKVSLLCPGYLLENLTSLRPLRNQNNCIFILSNTTFSIPK